MGGRRVEIQRPRARNVDGEPEMPLATHEPFADRDPATRAVLEPDARQRVEASVSAHAGAGR